MDDYIVLADIPTIQLESEEEFPGLKRRNQSPSPCRDQRLRTYRLVLLHDIALWQAVTIITRNFTLLVCKMYVIVGYVGALVRNLTVLV